MVSHTYIAVPIEMFIYAQKSRCSNRLRFFLLLKLLYKEGKTRLNSKELTFIEATLRIKDRKTTKKHIRFLQEAGWIRYNSKTQYYILSAFDKIRAKNDWNVRLAFPVNRNNYYNIQAITGAVIYGYLHRDFWRKVKRKKSVQVKGCAYHFRSPDFDYKEKPAPVSVIGVRKIFGIPISTASRLKNLAHKEKLIYLKKNYDKTKFDETSMKLCYEYNNLPKNVVYRRGKYRPQLIDTVYPLFNFKKRKFLET